MESTEKDSLTFLNRINKNIEQIEKKSMKNSANKVASKSSIVQQSRLRPTAEPFKRRQEFA